MSIKRSTKKVLYVVRARVAAFAFYNLPSIGTNLHITDKSHQHIEQRGLFSIFIETLDIIAANGKKNIDVCYSRTLYNDNSNENMWGYYFEPIINDTKRKYDTTSFTVRVYRDRRIKENRQMLGLLNRVLKERIRIRKNLTDKADSFFYENLPKTGVIGVHIRGTDHIRIYGNDVSLERYFSKIDELLNVGYTHILLATDDNRFFRAFKIKYGNKVVVYSKIRGESDAGIHFQNDEVRSLKGEEVVIDWLLLSKTGYFIHGESNVATAVLILNPDIKRVNLAIKIT